MLHEGIASCWRYESVISLILWVIIVKKNPVSSWVITVKLFVYLAYVYPPLLITWRFREFVRKKKHRQSDYAQCYLTGAFLNAFGAIVLGAPVGIK
jgi:hypothetical protein